MNLFLERKAVFCVELEVIIVITSKFDSAK